MCYPWRNATAAAYMVVHQLNLLASARQIYWRRGGAVQKAAAGLGPNQATIAASCGRAKVTGRRRSFAKSGPTIYVPAAPGPSADDCNPSLSFFTLHKPAAYRSAQNDHGVGTFLDCNGCRGGPCSDHCVLVAAKMNSFQIGADC